MTVRIYIVIDLLAHALPRDDTRVEQIVRDPDEVDAVLTGTLFKQTVHAVERLAAHVLLEDDHVGVELLAVLPELVEQDLVAAVGMVAHDHVLGQPGHVVIRLLAVFGRVLRDEFAR